MAFVNYYKILNYIHLGDIEGAVVECRRVNGKLERVRDAEGGYFKGDPFLQYLATMLFGRSRRRRHSRRTSGRRV